MENFRFENRTRIYFGTDAEHQLGKYLCQLQARHVLCIYGSMRIEKNGLLACLKGQLQENGIACTTLSGVTPNPGLRLVREGIAVCRTAGIDTLLAIGGGSVIDTAKAISLGVDYPGDVWDFFVQRATLTPRQRVLPVGVVLTVAGAGSETSASAVITNDLVSPMQKKDVTAHALRPKFALLNPSLTRTVPWHQTACGGIDALTHIMERYFTKVCAVDLTDRLCEAAMQSLIKNLTLLRRLPDSYAARAEVLWASTIAHNNLLSTGRRSDWASHMIEHELSALYPAIAHGEGLAAIFPAWMRFASARQPQIFAQFACRVWGIPYDRSQTDEDRAHLGIEALQNFFAELGVKTRLRDMSVSRTQFPLLAQSALQRGRIGDLVQLDAEDILAILESAY